MIRCLVYIDLNMVRAGVVRHPSQWELCGYNEIQRPRRKCVLICYETLMKLVGYTDYEAFRKAHRRWVEAALEKFDGRRQSHWTESIAVGSKKFIEMMKQQLSLQARGRRMRPLNKGMELRETTVSYNALFGLENEAIGVK